MHKKDLVPILIPVGLTVDTTTYSLDRTIRFTADLATQYIDDPHVETKACAADMYYINSAGQQLSAQPYVVTALPVVNTLLPGTAEWSSQLVMSGRPDTPGVLYLRVYNQYQGPASACTDCVVQIRLPTNITPNPIQP